MPTHGRGTHLLAHALVPELRHDPEDIAVERAAVLVHGRLAPPAGVHPEGGPVGDGRVEA